MVHDNVAHYAKISFNSGLWHIGFYCLNPRVTYGIHNEITLALTKTTKNLQVIWLFKPCIADMPICGSENSWHAWLDSYAKLNFWAYCAYFSRRLAMSY